MPSEAYQVVYFESDMALKVLDPSLQDKLSNVSTCEGARDMSVQSFVWGIFALTLIGCGEDRPIRSQYHSPGSAATAGDDEAKAGTKPTETNPMNSSTSDPETTATNPTPTPTPIPTPTPTPTPSPPVVNKVPIRTLANATEIANAKTGYGTDCANCHQALATSAKKGATLARINAAGVAGKVAAHNTLINGAKWPKDVADTSDDGVDTAMLKAAAMFEALK